MENIPPPIDQQTKEDLSLQMEQHKERMKGISSGYQQSKRVISKQSDQQQKYITDLFDEMMRGSIDDIALLLLIIWGFLQIFVWRAFENALWNGIILEAIVSGLLYMLYFVTVCKYMMNRGEFIKYYDRKYK